MNTGVNVAEHCGWLMSALAVLRRFVFYKEGSDGQVTARDTTMTFTTFVMYDMFNALACRSTNKTLAQIGTYSY